MGTAGGAVFPETQQSFAARAAGVFVSPVETFADITRRPDFLPLLVLGVAWLEPARLASHPGTRILFQAPLRWTCSTDGPLVPSQREDRTVEI